VSLGGGLAIPVSDFSNYWDTLGAKNRFDLDFSGGYFLTPNLSLGLAVEYGQFSVDNALNPQKYRLYTLGAYGKYFIGLDSKVSPYLRDILESFFKLNYFLFSFFSRCFP